MTRVRSQLSHFGRVEMRSIESVLARQRSSRRGRGEQPSLVDADRRLRGASRHRAGLRVRHRTRRTPGEGAAESLDDAPFAPTRRDIGRAGSSDSGFRHSGIGTCGSRHMTTTHSRHRGRRSAEEAYPRCVPAGESHLREPRANAGADRCESGGIELSRASSSACRTAGSGWTRRRCGRRRLAPAA